jgi:hypothetical protein
MNQLVITQATAAEFLVCNGRTELVDETGARIGYFEPLRPHDPALYARAKAMISDQELARRRQSEGGRTTAEVFERLHATQVERDAARQAADRQ